MTFDTKKIKELIDEYNKINSKYFDLSVEYTDKEEDEMVEKIAKIKNYIRSALVSIGIDFETAQIMVSTDANINKIYDIVNNRDKI